MKWAVTFNPYTNQFDYDAVSSVIRDNLINLSDKDFNKENTWLLVGIFETIEECSECANILKII